MLGNYPMERDDYDPQGNEGTSPVLQLAILSFWAAVMHIEQNFSRQEIAALPELSRAIQAAHLLPAAIGWDDVLASYMVEAL